MDAGLSKAVKKVFVVLFIETLTTTIVTNKPIISQINDRCNDLRFNDEPYGILSK